MEDYVEIAIGEDFITSKDYIHNEERTVSRSMMWLDFSINLRDDIHNWFMENEMPYQIIINVLQTQKIIDVQLYQGKQCSGTTKDRKYFIRFTNEDQALLFKLRWL